MLSLPSRDPALGGGPHSFCPCTTTPSVPMLATTQQLAKQPTATRPPTTGHWRRRIASPPRARTATATYLAGDKLGQACLRRPLRFAEDPQARQSTTRPVTRCQRVSHPHQDARLYASLRVRPRDLGPRCSYLLDGAMEPSEVSLLNMQRLWCHRLDTRGHPLPSPCLLSRVAEARSILRA